MKIFINWQKVDSVEEFYNKLLHQIEAPEWHGHNLNALRDSLITGDINAIEPPYCIVNTGTLNIKPEIQSFYLAVKGIFEEAERRNRGIRVFFD